MSEGTGKASTFKSERIINVRVNWLYARRGLTSVVECYASRLQSSSAEGDLTYCNTSLYEAPPPHTASCWRL